MMNKSNSQFNFLLNTRPSSAIDSYARALLGNLPIQWIQIPLLEFESQLQSGFGDVIFPPINLKSVRKVPANVSISPILFKTNCVFMNFYSNSSTEIIKKGILFPLRTIDSKVYLLLSLLLIIAIFFRVKVQKHQRNKNHLHQCLINWHIKITKGHFGLLIFYICSIAIHHVTHLLATSFTTKYSIAFRASPIIHWSDLESQSNIECGSMTGKYCYSQINRSLEATKLIHPIENGSVSGFIRERIDQNRIILFEHHIFKRRFIHIFCNTMINLRKDHNFHIHISAIPYYESFSIILYYSGISRDKKIKLLHSAYSCSEQGYCQGAYDRILRKLVEKGINRADINARCDDYKESHDGPDKSYHAISSTNIIDACNLFMILIGITCISLIIEICNTRKKKETITRSISIH